MSLAEEFPLRPLNRDDPQEVNLVIKSWLKTYYASREVKTYRALVSGDAQSFYRDYGPKVRELIDRSAITVAALAEDASAVAGWIASEGDAIHYVFVKPTFARLGIARHLVGAMATQPMAYTHMTLDVRKPGLPKAWDYVPMRRWAWSQPKKATGT